MKAAIVTVTCCGTLLFAWPELASGAVANGQALRPIGELETARYFKDKFNVQDNVKNLKEDEAYWERLLQESMSLPQPPTGVPPTPTVPLTPPPTPPPIPPTPFPTPPFIPPPVPPPTPPPTPPTPLPTPPPVPPPTPPPTQPLTPPEECLVDVSFCLIYVMLLSILM